jgi:hypothetical protein
MRLIKRVALYTGFTRMFNRLRIMLRRWLKARKLKHYGVRLAKLSDLDFILQEVLEGAKAGHYRDTLLQPEQLKGWREQLGNVINSSHLVRYADQRNSLELLMAKLLVYGAANDDQVGFMLMAERFPGTANVELELYQAGVRSSRRGEGHGQNLVKQFANFGESGVSLYARCLRPSGTMLNLLLSEGFEVISISPKGTRELAKRSTKAK